MLIQRSHPFRKECLNHEASSTPPSSTMIELMAATNPLFRRRGSKLINSSSRDIEENKIPANTCTVLCSSWKTTQCKRAHWPQHTLYSCQLSEYIQSPFNACQGNSIPSQKTNVVIRYHNYKSPYRLVRSGAVLLHLWMDCVIQSTHVKYPPKLETIPLPPGWSSWSTRFL